MLALLNLKSPKLLGSLLAKAKTGYRLLSIQAPTAQSLQQLTSNRSFESAKRWVDRDGPRSAMISQWLKLNIDKPGGLGTSGNELCFVDSWPDPNIIAAIDFLKAYGDDKFPKLTMFTEYGIDGVHAGRVDKFVTRLVEKVDFAGHGGIEVRGLFPEWRPLFDKVFEASIKTWPCRGYWMPADEQQWIREYPPKAPEGFEFGSLRQEDAKRVDDVWEFRTKDSSIYMIQRQIRDFPNVCLRETHGEKRLACFMMVEAETGLMSHLYAMPDFRRRGLGSLVEYQLARLLVDKGHTPTKMVLSENVHAVKITEESPFWKYTGDSLFILYGNQEMARKYVAAKE